MMLEGERLVTRVYVASAPEAIPTALQALRTRQVVAFPTDTVYGVGCDPWRSEAIECLYWAKQRPKELAIPVLVSAPEHVAQVASSLPPQFAALVERFWPGGLTVIVPRRASLPDVLCAGGPTVAVRMPDHAVALRLVAEMGGALAATSANLSSRPAPTTAAEVLADLDGRVAVVLDGGPCPGGVASSIVDLVSNPPVLLRQGNLALEVLRAALPALVVTRR
jgi:L-threonylcarbamoyladenylate synthase